MLITIKKGEAYRIWVNSGRKKNVTTTLPTTNTNLDKIIRMFIATVTMDIPEKKVAIIYRREAMRIEMMDTDEESIQRILEMVQYDDAESSGDDE